MNLLWSSWWENLCDFNRLDFFVENNILEIDMIKTSNSGYVWISIHIQIKFNLVKIYFSILRFFWIKWRLVMMSRFYVQGLGETFGRVTVEAMAFGLPVRQLTHLPFWFVYACMWHMLLDVILLKLVITRAPGISPAVYYSIILSWLGCVSS